MPERDTNACNTNACNPQDCASCSSACSKKQQPEDLRLPQNPFSHVKRVIGVVSGKGGVGKSTVTSLLACEMQSRGFACGILDADVTGPSIPKAFGVSGRCVAQERGLAPRESKTGIRLMSVNLLLEQEDLPVVWRGPVISGVIGQFWQEVVWGELDYLFVDMPPGTGDVPLTVFQRLPLDGIFIVTTPQDLVAMIVRKAYHMARQMQIPVLGLIENMSYFLCPDCNTKHSLFGESKLDAFSQESGVPILARLPLQPQTAALMDGGKAELADSRILAPAAEFLEQQKWGNEHE